MCTVGLEGQDTARKVQQLLFKSDPSSSALLWDGFGVQEISLSDTMIFITEHLLFLGCGLEEPCLIIPECKIHHHAALINYSQL